MTLLGQKCGKFGLISPKIALNYHFRGFVVFLVRCPSRGLTRHHLWPDWMWATPLY